MDDWMGYQGKVCVVTGASSGMGKATVEMLVELGARVYAIARRPMELPGVEKYIQANLNDRSSIDAAFEELPGKIDAFFGIAGATGHHGSYVDTYITNFIANKYMAEKYLKKRVAENGSITFVSSAAGLRWKEKDRQAKYLPVVKAADWDEAVQILESGAESALPGKVAYPTSKEALNYYASALSLELAPRKIRVNAVLPGSTDTGMTGDFLASLGSMDRLVACGGLTDRLATPREMAGPIVFVGSALASYLSGCCLMVGYGLEAQRALAE